MTRRRGMSLLELVMAMLVLSIAAGVLAPVLAAAGDSYAAASRAARASAEAAAALDRVAAMLRDAPPGAAAGTLGVASVEEGAIALTDGRALAVEDGVLWMTSPEGERAPLASGVERFRVSCLGEDGASVVDEQPEQAQRFRIDLRVDGLELSTCVFARARLGGS